MISYFVRYNYPLHVGSGKVENFEDSDIIELPSEPTSITDVKYVLKNEKLHYYRDLESTDIDIISMNRL